MVFPRIRVIYCVEFWYFLCFRYSSLPRNFLLKFFWISFSLSNIIGSSTQHARAQSCYKCVECAKYYFECLFTLCWWKSLAISDLNWSFKHMNTKKLAIYSCTCEIVSGRIYTSIQQSSGSGWSLITAQYDDCVILPLCVNRNREKSDSYSNTCVYFCVSCECSLCCNNCVALSYTQCHSVFGRFNIIHVLMCDKWNETTLGTRGALLYFD